MGGVQGDPLFLDLFCLGQAPSVAWTDVALSAALNKRELDEWDVERENNVELAAVTAPPTETWMEIKQWVRQNTVRETPRTTCVVTKFYVDDGVRGVDRQLIEPLSTLTNIAAQPAGLRYKPSAWMAWSPDESTVGWFQTKYGPQAQVKILRPEDGMVVCSAPAGVVTADALMADQVAVGGTQFHETLCKRMVRKVRAATAAVERAVNAASRADVAPQDGVSVLIKAVQHKVQYIERVFPPQIAAAYVEEARDEIWQAAGRVLGWKPDESKVARAQGTLPWTW